MLEHSGPICIKFFYRMYGGDMGSLFVLASNAWLTQPLFSRSGDQRDDWHEATVDTYVSNHERVGRMFEINHGLHMSSVCLSKHYQNLSGML